MIAIKDMEMPSNCFECPIFYDYLHCPLVDKKNEGGLDKHKASNCPLIEIEEPKTEHCKDCKWWKDSDGAFRRGIGAESQCPINREEVYEGNGYCFMFEPQESEDKE